MGDNSGDTKAGKTPSGIIPAMFPIVALDLETTGLDPIRDAILEIGAVKFDENGIIDRWQSLINPQRLVPTPITQLTGISNEMVRDAPPIKAVIQDFADFVGDLPVIGHNVRFDLGFLKIQHAFDRNPVNDTFEIAAVLLPQRAALQFKRFGGNPGSLQLAAAPRPGRRRSNHGGVLALDGKGTRAAHAPSG